MFRKGQAAMEFLMTYGWAILVVLAAIGALAYFGVLSPDRFLPEKCTLPSGMACLDFAASTSNIEVVIQNSGGFDMSSVNVTLTLADTTVVQCVDNDADARLVDGETDNFNCASTYDAGKLKATLSVGYVNDQTQLAHTKVGELIAKVG